MSTTKTTTAARVADACGMTFFVKHGVVFAGTEESHWTFEPDLNAEDAVLAAEKYGLFFGNDIELTGLTLDGGIPGWGVWIKEPGKPTDLIGSGTFCEAICQAILWFEERKPKG